MQFGVWESPTKKGAPINPMIVRLSQNRFRQPQEQASVLIGDLEIHMNLKEEVYQDVAHVIAAVGYRAQYYTGPCTLHAT